MARRDPPQIESAGSDSFLDVVTNIVGILIILVMVVGERARRTVVPTLPLAEVKAPVDLAPLEQQATTVEGDVNRLTRQIESVAREVEARRQEREAVATIISAAEMQLEKNRDKLSAGERAKFDLARKLSLARVDLARLEDERQRTAEVVPANIKVESYPTPLSKPVDGKELHLQLKDGHVAIVPIDELVERLKKAAPERARRLLDQPEVSDTVGPVEGFRMRYTLRRVDISMQTTVETGRTGSYVQVAHFEVVPVTDSLGEPLDKALSPTSALRGKLDTMNPREWTVTLWTYPDSFTAFRALRKEFYQLGYAVAGRPLPDGLPIGGSPQGSKSAAQ